jgi:superfamily I DNA/RNA helicase
MSFKPYDIDKEKRWLYTAITRAEDRVVLVIDDKYYNWHKKYFKFDDDYYNKMDEFISTAESYEGTTNDCDDYVNITSASDFDFVEE